MAPKLFFFLILFTATGISNQTLTDSTCPGECWQKFAARLTRLEDHIWNDPSEEPPLKTNGTLPRSCKDAQEQGHTESTIFEIQPLYAPEPFKVLCNMTKRGGGWTYILNRYDGSQDFYLDWNSYKNGFGNLSGEFWLGLEKIHLLTGYESNEILIELVDWNDIQATAHYRSFGIDDEDNGYSLKALGGFSGDAGNSIKANADMKFTTKDKDNDKWDEGNCANWSNSGWWHNSCKSAQLTGIYRPKNYGLDPSWKSMHWEGFRGSQYSLKQARMMVRPIEPSGLLIDFFK